MSNKQEEKKCYYMYFCNEKTRKLFVEHKAEENLVLGKIFS